MFDSYHRVVNYIVVYVLMKNTALEYENVVPNGKFIQKLKFPSEHYNILPNRECNFVLNF